MSLAETLTPAMDEFETEFTEDESAEVDPVVAEAPRIYWNAISSRAFDEYRHLKPSSPAAIHRRNGFAMEFAKMELLHKNIFRGEE